MIVRERADIAGLPGALDTQRVGLGRHRVLLHLERANLVGARQAIIYERAGEELARSLVIDELFGEGLADALRNPAMDLACKRERVDDRTDIVDDDIAQYPGSAGLGIDLDLADMAAVGEVRDLAGKLTTS